MSLYLTAFRGRHGGADIPGIHWTPEAGQNLRLITEALRQEAPWLGARISGREIFTVGVPDNPEADHLVAQKDGAWKPDLHNQGTRGLVLMLLLRRLKEKRVLVDLRTGFATVRSEELPDGRMAVDGLELHIEAAGRLDFLLWFHPVRRLLDPRPTALDEHGHRALDIWFPLEGVSVASAHPKRSPGGHSLQVGRRGRFVREGDPAAVILSESVCDFSAQSLVQSVRTWFGNSALEGSGLSLDADPCSAEDLKLAQGPLPAPTTVGLDWDGREIPLDEVFRFALGGQTALRLPRLPPATFHLRGLKDPSKAEEVATVLNQRAAEWPGVALQFAAEPVAGSEEIALDAKAPVVNQPRSARASGQAAGLFLECVQRAGGSPWRLDGPSLGWSLGVAQAFLYGKMHHLAFALLDPSGRISASLVVPFRFSDLAEAAFGKSIASKLWQQAPPGLTVHVDESLDLPPHFLDGFCPSADVWHLRRRSAPRVISATSFAWLPPGEVAFSDDRAFASLDSETGTRFLYIERLRGVRSPLDALEAIIALEHAWVPGRAERRLLPATLEWARGLLFQRDRFQAFAPGRLN
jgi:hypothetical protein